MRPSQHLMNVEVIGIFREQTIYCGVFDGAGW